MANGKIPNALITASSVFGSPNPLYAAHNGRLHGNRIETWISGINDTKQWLHIDLGEATVISGVATQGRYTNAGGQWVASYLLSHSNGNAQWTIYKQGETNKVTMVSLIDL